MTCADRYAIESEKWKEPNDASFHLQDFQIMSSDQRCRGGRRAACGPEGERIAGFLKKKSGLQAFKPQPF